jgi:hypothetical protein
MNRHLSAQDGSSSRAIVKDVTMEVEKRLMDLTINAPNWYVSLSIF